MQSTTHLKHLLQGKRLLIFDFDGTVADTSPLHAAAFAQALNPMGVEVDYPRIAGMKTLDAMRKCLTDAGRDTTMEALDELVALKQKTVRQMIAKDLSALPGVDAFLRWAQPRYQLSMATSGSRGTVLQALEKLGYVDWFSPLVCADDVLHAKPDPECFLKVLQMTGVMKNDALVFEDSTAGFISAQNAGLQYIDVRNINWCNELACFGADNGH